MLDATDCRLMSTFELIDRINCADSWNDENVDIVLRELWERYGDGEQEYGNIKHPVWGFNLPAEEIYGIIVRNVYKEIEMQLLISINEKEYFIISIPTDETCEYAVTDDPSEFSGFEVYSFGTMKECKKYIKELIDNA